ncbi:unnamed protein product [Hymenolepis diminuta]|uniref:Uncharacterized protein n=1 Tax=Hymenolepis diminuta TaxID=6216 RepID=A0A564YTA7_HYMDI|nr:unnamed protein product [Hymenolepis diminuta]
MERHVVIVSIKVKHRILKIVRFYRVVISFVCIVRKALLTDNNGGELASMKKRKQEHFQRSAHSLNRTFEFVKEYMAWHDGRKSCEDILPNIFKCLKKQQYI